MSSNIQIEDIMPTDVWEALASNQNAVLIDVRTDVEWNSIGAPGMPDGNSNCHFISWQFAPDMRVNAGFLDDMEAAGIGRDVPIYFLCRSGVRSKAAATIAASAGYGPCYNVAEGFEGLADASGARYGGWRGNGLPETQLNK